MILWLVVALVFENNVLKGSASLLLHIAYPYWSVGLLGICELSDWSALSAQMGAYLLVTWQRSLMRVDRERMAHRMFRIDVVPDKLT